MVNLLKDLLGDKRGVTAVEYGLIAGLIAVTIIGAVTALGTHLASTFGTIESTIGGG